MDRGLSRTLREIRADTVSGASALTIQACSAMLSFSKSPWGKTTGDDLREFLLALVRAQPNMASLWNLANRVLLGTRTPDELHETCTELIEIHENATQAVASNAAEYLAGKTVVTNSSSSAALLAVVIASKRAPVHVRVAESRPNREGLLMARELAKKRVPVTVYSDASLGLATAGADIAAVGCDAVNPRGVIGKVGLLHLALAARERGIEVLVLADSSKFAPIALTRDPRPAREIVEGPPKGVKVENSYFEEVLLRHFDGIVTERGRLAPRVAAAAARRVALAPELESITAVLKSS